MAKSESEDVDDKYSDANRLAKMHFRRKGLHFQMEICRDPLRPVFAIQRCFYAKYFLRPRQVRDIQHAWALIRYDHFFAGG